MSNVLRAAVAAASLLTCPACVTTGSLDQPLADDVERHERSDDKSLAKVPNVRADSSAPVRESTQVLDLSELPNSYSAPQVKSRVSPLKSNPCYRRILGNLTCDGCICGIGSGCSQRSKDHLDGE